MALLHNRLAGGVEAFGITVALGGGQVAHHVLQNLFRRFEAKRCRVANVELQDSLAFLFQALGVIEYRAANVVANVVQFV